MTRWLYVLLIYMCDVTRSYVRRDSSICVTWLIHVTGDETLPVGVFWAHGRQHWCTLARMMTIEEESSEPSASSKVLGSIRHSLRPVFCSMLQCVAVCCSVLPTLQHFWVVLACESSSQNPINVARDAIPSTWCTTADCDATAGPAPVAAVK